MDLQFNVTLNNQKIEFKSYSNLDNLKEIPKFKEYENLSLKFTSEKNIFLEIPSLIDYSIVQRDNLTGNDILVENKIFPSIYKIKLFENSDTNDGQNVPLLPGIYQIKVTTNNGEFFGKFQIIPKDLSILDWKSMIEDIEKTSLGLAQSSTKSGEYRPTENDEKYILRDSSMEKLIEYSQEIENVVEQIISNPIYEINKKYKWVHKGKEKFIDNNTIKNIIPYSSKLYSPERYLSFDNNSNGYIKFILNRFLKIGISTKKVIEQIKNEKIENSRTIEINKKLSKINNFNFFIYQSLRTTFFKNVKERNKSISKSLILNRKYNKIYKIYEDVINKKTNLDRKVFLKYYWKETSKLYEIWTYIMVLKALKELNYKPSGWIFNGQRSYELKQGTLVKFSSVEKNIFLNVIYDDELGTSKNSIDLLHPLKTESGNRRRPDIRIDLFNNHRNDYLGSIILDAKYMPAWKISSNDRVDKQLHDYRKDLVSPIFSKLDHHINPIGYVDAIAASGDENDKRNIKNKSRFDENTFKFFILNPSHGFDHFKDKLNEQINEQVDYIIKERNLYNY